MAAPAPAPAAAPAAEAAPLDHTGKVKRLASFLIVLGPELASEILKGLDNRDVKEISAEMAKIDLVDFETQQGLLQEFSQMAVKATTSVAGGQIYTRQVLEKSVGAFQAGEMLQNVSPALNSPQDATAIQGLDPQYLYNLLRTEDPQTMAFILSYLDPAKCGAVLSMIEDELRSDIVMRIAAMEPVPSEVLAKVLENLKKRVTVQGGSALKTGGVNSIAEAIKSMDHAASKSVITMLDDKNPELSNAIKKILFNFEDLRGIDTMSLQKVLREVESKDLALAMKTATEPLQKKIFTALPKRAAASIQDEIKFMGPVRLKEVEGAQERIIDAMRRLEAQGEISTGTGGGGDVMV